MSSWAKRPVADFGWGVVSLRPWMKLMLFLGRRCLLPVMAEATVSANAFWTWSCHQWQQLSARAFTSCWGCVWWILFQSRGHRVALQSCPRQGSSPDLVGHRTKPGSGNGLCSSLFAGYCPRWPIAAWQLYPCTLLLPPLQLKLCPGQVGVFLCPALYRFGSRGRPYRHVATFPTSSLYLSQDSSIIIALLSNLLP